MNLTLPLKANSERIPDMEIISTALDLLKRQAALEEGLRQPGGIRVTEERELHTLRERLARFPYPNAIEAVIEAARNLGRPIDLMTVPDVERWSGTPHQSGGLQ